MNTGISALRSPVGPERIDDVCHRLRVSGGKGNRVSADALALINELAARMVAIENELAQAYDERTGNEKTSPDRAALQ
jgi:hypothetical protein